MLEVRDDVMLSIDKGCARVSQSVSAMLSDSLFMVQQAWSPPNHMERHAWGAAAATFVSHLE